MFLGNYRGVGAMRGIFATLALTFRRPRREYDRFGKRPIYAALNPVN